MIAKTLVKRVKLMTGRYKRILTINLEVSAKINKCHKKSYISLDNNDCETPYIGIYIDLLSINFTVHTLALCLPLDQWLWRLYCTNNYMIAKYIVLSNIITVLPGSILRICTQEPLLILKKFIVLLHTLSAYNRLLFHYKVYSSDPSKVVRELSSLISDTLGPRRCLCTSGRYDGA